MSFELSAEEQLIAQSVRELAAGPNGRAHWRERALANEFLERLWQALADAGYLGLLVPQEYEDRAGVPGDDPQLSRRARARPATLILGGRQ